MYGFLVFYHAKPVKTFRNYAKNIMLSIVEITIIEICSYLLRQSKTKFLLIGPDTTR